MTISDITPSVRKQSDMSLDHEKMLQEIDAVVNNDWGFDIDCRALHPEQEWTQKEAQEMADALMKIYTISHCISCKGCQSRYMTNDATIGTW